MRFAPMGTQSDTAACGCFSARLTIPQPGPQGNLVGWGGVQGEKWDFTLLDTPRCSTCLLASPVRATCFTKVAFSNSQPISTPSTACCRSCWASRCSTTVPVLFKYDLCFGHCFFCPCCPVTALAIKNDCTDLDMLIETLKPQADHVRWPPFSYNF